MEEFNRIFPDRTLLKSDTFKSIEAIMKIVHCSKEAASVALTLRAEMLREAERQEKERDKERQKQERDKERQERERDKERQERDKERQERDKEREYTLKKLELQRQASGAGSLDLGDFVQPTYT